MATRHLRKLQEQLLQQQQEPQGDKQESESEEEQAGPASAPFNPFDLLTDEEDAADDRADEDSSDEAADTPPPAKPPPAASTSSSSRKKGKKKKGKGKGKAAAGGSDSEAAGPAAAQQAEDIDAILAQLGMDAGPSTSAAAGGAASKPSDPPLLAIDAKKLRGDEELRRIFGSAVVDAVDRQDAADSHQQQQRRRGHVPRHLLKRRPLRKSVLVNPREEWPWVDTGLGMEVVGALPDGTPLFSYTWSPEYRSAQQAFHAAQASYDPNAIAGLLQAAPFHLDSLLAMYDLYRSMGEVSYAEEVLNRALYALEMAWHPRFDPGRGVVRLESERAENRALFVALFRHAQALSRRGCHSSALEVGKLLLALDPEDPLGVLLQLDYLAVRSGQYAWLQRFASQHEGAGGQSLPLLPNYTYSLALARFKQMQQPQVAVGEAGSGAASTGSGSRGGGGSSSSSSRAAAATPAAAGGSSSGEGYEVRTPQEVLVQALLMYPVVLPKLQQRLQGQGVGNEPAWQQLLARPLYASAGDGGSSSLSHLVSLFVERSHQLWRTQDVQTWLREGGALAADIAEGKASPDAAGGVAAGDWAAVARQTFPADAGGNDYGHLRLSDFTDTVNALPREEMDAAMAAGGVGELQAALDEHVAALLAQQAAAGGGGGGGRGPGGAGMTEEELREGNPLLMLLQSLLPWVNAGQAPDYGAEEGEGGGAGGQPGAAN